MLWYKCMNCGEIYNDREDFPKKVMPYTRGDGTIGSVRVDCCPKCYGNLESFSEDDDRDCDDDYEDDEDDD